MASPTKLTSQVSTDAAPTTPQFSGESMDFSALTMDAMAGRRRQVSTPDQPAATPTRCQDEQRRSDQQRQILDLEILAESSIEKIKGLTLDVDKRKDEDQSYTHDSVGPISTSEMPSADWEEDLLKYQEEMPLEVKVPYFDALVLYAEEDRKEAEIFRQHLEEDIDIGANEKVKAMLYDCPDLTTLSGSQIGHLANAVDRATYVFMYLSEHFVKDKWMEFSSESCLMTAIYDTEKRWCVVPVYTQKRASCKFRIPMGLNSLKGVNYYNNDEFYRRGVARLIKDKVPQRKQMNEKLKITQKMWVENYKRKQHELKEQQKRVQMMEEMKTAEALKKLKDDTEYLVETGQLAGFPHSQSEGQLSTPNHSLPHIHSADSLKDVHKPQNPAVQEYFQNLVTHCRRQNDVQAYTGEQVRMMQNRYGGNTQSPTQMQNAQPPSWNAIHHQHAQTAPKMASTTSTVHRDNPVSTVHEQYVSFHLQSNQGAQDVFIPKELSDQLQNFPDVEKQKLVKLYFDEVEKNAGIPQNLSQISQIYQQNPSSTNPMANQSAYVGMTSQYPADMGQVNLPGTINQSFEQFQNPLDKAPQLSMSLQKEAKFAADDHVRREIQRTQGQASHGLGGTSSQGSLNNNADLFLNQPVNQLQEGTPLQNQPDFSALLSHNSSFPSSGTRSGEQIGNQVPRGHLNQGGNIPFLSGFDQDITNSQSLEEDCGSVKFSSSASSMAETTPKNQGRSLHTDMEDQGRSPQSAAKSRVPEDKGEDDTKTKKKKSSKSKKNEKHIHYTINVYQAEAVQIGNQNMVQGLTGGKPDSDDSSDEEDDSLPLTVEETTKKKFPKSQSPPSTFMLKKDPDNDDDDDTSPRAETEDQPQPTCNMDAPASSVSSRQDTSYHQHHSEQPSAATKKKIAAMDELEKRIEKPSSSAKQNSDPTQVMKQTVLTTNQLPEGMEKFLHGDSNYEASAAVEKSSLKDKVILDDNKLGKGFADKVHRQDSKNNPIVARITPMRPKLPSDNDGGNTDVKEVVPSDQTGVKFLPECGGDRAPAQGPVQLLTKRSADCDNVDKFQSNLDNNIVNVELGGTSRNNLSAVNAGTSQPNRATFSTQQFTNATNVFYRNRREPGDQLTPVQYGYDPLTNSSNQGGASEGFTPEIEDSPEHRVMSEKDLEYDMCSVHSDSSEGLSSRSCERSASGSAGKPKKKTSKECVIS